ncbi:MAG: B12-binding domain-containing radical SAM protein [Peptostreptococcus porci]|uniref:DUF4080 domain-containing protein n=1 Tax=Peptostreptococcus porci TaxID=2652282 RepID=A0A6N7X0M8_9FIRM|nr:B12-binding domain-containing radical SAM protein [Peptostreptococcus porci]MDY5480041.1 B12-binding domain-containing radical SAM protein [Peptostreptococcus porci]MST62520.1 DUF4080 domain-containing protein [Peptostreptococcus porci]
MKVLLTTLNSKFIHTNLAIRYIREYSKYLEGDDYSVMLREYTINNSIDYIMKDIVKMNVDMIVFSTYIWNIEDIKKICNNIKKVKPEIVICLGGPEVSYDYLNLIEEYDFADFILFGEGEVIYRDLILHFIKNKDIESVRGICYKKNGCVIANESMPLIENLDDIPSPYRNIDVSEYENKIVYFESSRGCPFDCQFCLSSTLKGLRYFSTERIKSDLKSLIDAKVSQIKFIDRTFNANKKIAIDIMKFLMENDNGKTSYHFEVTAHLLDEEMLTFLRDCKPGLFQFEIGVQSTNEQSLVAVGRTDDFEKLTKVVRRISSYKNIHQHLDLIAGLPFEDYDRFGLSFDDVYGLYPECLQLGFLKMIKGTGLRNSSDAFGYEYKDYPPYEILSNKFIAYDEILKLKDIEEILEIYYNSGNFNVSIDYIIARYYDRPFVFYEQFSVFFDENGYFDISLGKNKLYEVLLGFAKKIISEREEFIVFKELVKFDYLSMGKQSTIPSFFDRIDVQDYKDKGHKFLQNEENQRKYVPKYFGTPAKNIVKHIHFEEFKYDVIGIKEKLDKLKLNGELEKVCFDEICEIQTSVLFFYDIDKIFEKSKTYRVKL